MPSNTQCCVPGCKDTEGVRRVLHSFPNSEKDKERFNIWFNAIGGDLVGMEKEQISKYRRVCHAHFERKYLCRYNRITKNAVPTLNMPGVEATRRLEAPPTTMEAEATNEETRAVVSASLVPPTSEMRTNAEADAVVSRKLVLPPSPKAEAIVDAEREAASGANATTPLSLEQGGPWTVVTSKKSNRQPQSDKVNNNTGNMEKDEPANAQVSAVSSAPKTPISLKPGTSGAKAPAAKNMKASNEGKGKNSTNKRQLPEDATTPNAADKKARTGATPKTYAAGAKSDHIAAVTATNAGHLTKAQAEEVEEILNNKLWSLVQARANNPPMFQGKPTYVNGLLQLWCMNVESMEWIRANIDGHTLTSGVQVEVRRQCNLPRKVRCGILIPGKADTNQIGEALRYFNPWAGVDRWLLHTAQKQTAGTFIVVSIPEDLIPHILEHGRQLCYMLGAVYVKFEERKGKFSETPPKVESTKNKEEAKQPKTIPPSAGNAAVQPSTSKEGNNTPQATVFDTTHELASVEMASVSDGAESVGDWAQGMEELDIGMGDDSDDGLPFTN